MPDDEEYGRVTNPARYRAVQDFARGLIDDLTASFDVQLASGLNADDDFVRTARGFEIEDLFRVAPSSPSCASITFAFTGFPGVVIRAGEWFVRAFPACGCDACDEHPSYSIAELGHDVDAISGGRFTESWDGEQVTCSRVYPHGSASGSWLPTVGEADPAQHAAPRTHDWKEWPRKVQ
jgi:hypothetical protein